MPLAALQVRPIPSSTLHRPARIQWYTEENGCSKLNTTAHKLAATPYKLQCLAFNDSTCLFTHTNTTSTLSRYHPHNYNATRSEHIIRTIHIYNEREKWENLICDQCRLYIQAKYGQYCFERLGSLPPSLTFLFHVSRHVDSVHSMLSKTKIHKLFFKIKSN